ncbi:MAG: hypothetical protein ACI9LM_003369 [Alteromonadaceae bacterium]|jgi:hypothetical protein
MNAKLVFILSILVLHHLVSVQVNAEVRTGTLVHQSQVFTKPMLQSKTIKTLSANEVIKVHFRQRAWYNISSEDEIFGWVKMLNVRFSGVIKRESETGVASLLSSAAGGSNFPTVSTGVRGFDEEDLKKAKASLKQIARLNSYAVEKTNLQSFINKGRLVANNIIVNKKVAESAAKDDGENK